jgi:hypothetical protein
MTGRPRDRPPSVELAGRRVTEPGLTVQVIVERIAIFVAAPLTELGRWWRSDSQKPLAHNG